MSKIIFFFINTIYVLFFLLSVSNGVVYFIQNIHKEDSFRLSVLLALLIISFLIIVDAYKWIKGLYKDLFLN